MARLLHSVSGPASASNLTPDSVLSPPDPPSQYLIIFTLWLLVFSASSQIMIIAPILPLIGEELGIADAALGTLISAYSLMVGMFAILSGPVSDRVGRRRILILGCLTMTAALILHAFVVGYYSIPVCECFREAHASLGCQLHPFRSLGFR